MTNISRVQAQIQRDQISRLIERGLSHDQIIDQLQISKSTFYRNLKTMRDIETKVWAKVEIDSARYRALALLRSFEDTARICTQIANSGNTTNKDRIEACKARDMALAHIYRLINEGTMFQHLPEIKAYTIPKDTTTTTTNNQLEYQEDSSSSDDDSSSSNEVVVEHE